MSGKCVSEFVMVANLDRILGVAKTRRVYFRGGRGKQRLCGSHVNRPIMPAMATLWSKLNQAAQPRTQFTPEEKKKTSRQHGSQHWATHEWVLIVHAILKMFLGYQFSQENDVLAL